MVIISLLWFEFSFGFNGVLWRDLLYVDAHGMKKELIFIWKVTAANCTALEVFRTGQLVPLELFLLPFRAACVCSPPGIGHWTSSARSAGLDWPWWLEPWQWSWWFLSSSIQKGEPLLCSLRNKTNLISSLGSRRNYTSRRTILWGAVLEINVTCSVWGNWFHQILSFSFLSEFNISKVLKIFQKKKMLLSVILVFLCWKVFGSDEELL